MNQTLKSFLFFAAVVISSVCYSQSTDLARIEYTYFPQSDSDNSFRRFRSFVNFPLKLNNKGAYLIPGVEYENTNLKYQDIVLFDTRDLERFQALELTLGYTYSMSEQWRFGVQGGVKVASNLERGDILKDDVIYTGAVYFIKTKEDERYEEPVRLILGLAYSTTSGIPFPLPVINYYKRFSSNWSYTLGIPKSNLKYYINDKNSLQGFATLDGFFANIQRNFDVNPMNTSSDDIAENISMTIVLAGLGYEYNFTDHFSFYLYAGHTLMNNIRLRDENLEKVYTINETNSYYGRGGLKFSIL